MVTIVFNNISSKAKNYQSCEITFNDLTIDKKERRFFLVYEKNIYTW